MSNFKPKPYWLIHHRELLEWTVEPIKDRREYIQAHKEEDQIALRLKWMKPVKNPQKLPKEILVELKKYTQPIISSSADRLNDDLHFMLEDNKSRIWKALVKQHKEEYPDCPWDYLERNFRYPDGTYFN